MSEYVIISLSAIIILGVGAQWLAWRLKFPSILFLLIIGFIAGPVTGLLSPDDLMGDLLLPFVSISVALILFEGGLTLQIKELGQIGKVFFSLISVGMIVTWAIGGLAAYTLLGLNIQLSILLGAILVVTGPTVIGPLLRHIRPSGRVGDILKWEGIVIDPIGALLAILVFEAILQGNAAQATESVLLNLGKTILFGGITGFAFARILVFLMRKYLIPDYLQESVTLMLVIASFLISNLLQEESGLFATTLMGIVLANQKQTNVKHILEFKENLSLLIISILFIILSARLNVDVFNNLSWMTLIYLLVLILVARPLSVWLSSLGMGLNWREKVFLSWMAPRGIVAAAVSSIFALKLAEAGIPQSEYLVPVTFAVIVGTVVVYGLSSPWLALKLKISQANPQGVLIAGAHPWAVEIATVLQSEGIKILLVDNNLNDVLKARMKGVPAVKGNVLSERTHDEISFEGIGRMMALTPNDEVNTLAALHFTDEFGRGETYQLAPTRVQEKQESSLPTHLRGRYLFREEADFQYMLGLFEQGYTVKSTKLSEEFGYEDFRKFYDDKVLTLCIIEEGKLDIITSDEKVDPGPGEVVIALVAEKEENNLNISKTREKKAQQGDL